MMLESASIFHFYPQAVSVLSGIASHPCAAPLVHHPYCYWCMVLVTAALSASIVQDVIPLPVDSAEHQFRAQSLSQCLYKCLRVLSHQIACATSGLVPTDTTLTTMTNESRSLTLLDIVCEKLVATVKELLSVTPRNVDWLPCVLCTAEILQVGYSSVTWYIREMTLI